VNRSKLEDIALEVTYVVFVYSRFRGKVEAGAGH
jgi:hypothetical protein